MPLSEDALTRLFLTEEPVLAELAIVLGSAEDAEAERRAIRAAEIYHTGLVPHLVLTGGDTAGRGTSEAERMAVILDREGVPAAALWLETQSRTTWDNARFCLEVLREKGLLEGLQTVLLISGPWHLRRARLIMRSYFPDTIHWVCCASRGGCEAGNWNSCDEHHRVVETEIWLLGEILRVRGIAVSDFLF